MQEGKIVGVEYQDVSFIPKRVPGDEAPWVRFGSSKVEYEKWIPQVCGICCLKMVGDTFGLTSHLSLYELTMKCVDKGGFKVNEDQTISGVYHYPLLSLAQALGLDGTVEKYISPKDIQGHLLQNRMVVLSIDLGKDTAFKGNHLLVVHRYLSKDNTYLVHDCAYAVGKEGASIALTEERLDLLSNRRGLSLWK